MVTIFRIVEPCAGSLTINGVEALRLGLQNLRRAISVIPQVSGSGRREVRPKKYAYRQYLRSLSKTQPQQGKFVCVVVAFLAVCFSEHSSRYFEICVVWFDHATFLRITHVSVGRYLQGGFQDE